MRDDGDNFVRVTFYAVVMVFIGGLALVKGCSDGPAAEAVLRSQGYTEVRTGGWTWSCGDDSQCTSFTAKAPGGARVEGAVGCGWLVKGCTVRTTIAPPSPSR